MQNRALEFREQLAVRAMVADGAMRSMLYSRGVFFNRCLDELNLASPDTVKDIHQEYARAGAEILETNTCGANRLRLGSFGMSERLCEINQAGVKLAREAAGRDAFVAGAVGPLGVHIEPLGALSFTEARALFSEQIQALVDAGVDLILLESFSSLNELEEAIRAVRSTAGDDMTVVAQVTIDDNGNLHDGTATADFTRRIDESPADVIGCNCSEGPKVMLETIEKMRAFSRKPMSAMPNAGYPVRMEGRNVYLCSPEYMAQYVRRFLSAGVKIIGGCCGTTPEHIKLLRAEAQSLPPGRRRPAVAAERHVKAEPMPEIPMAKKSRLGAKLASGKFVTFVEILPPRGVDYSKEIEGARLCAESGIDCINVPDGPRASARMSAQVACRLIQEHAGIEAVLHFCCRDRNILGIQSELLGAQADGVRNLICITGDPPRMGDYPDATAVFDVDSIGLVNIVKGLNRGLDIGGNPIGSQTALLIGVGANPGSSNPDEELRRMEWKIQAGAEFIVTQPVFDVDLLEKFLRRVQHPGLPVIAGIWPLTSYRNAEFMINELRVPVPKELMERMRRTDTREAAGREGVAIARKLVQRLQPLVQGIQVNAPMGRYRTAVEVAEPVLPNIAGRDA